MCDILFELNTYIWQSPIPWVGDFNI